ncbi:hypothetical protein HID58_079104 [Brassica napus]|uniref:(rape) hypothetical protein n=1 Tax=Brassica napus TaxID=3708 RepID=A0A816U6C4_BRANA|nr:hypothetical protein HID58_079104 [Brassica napus]CAF2105281.1 unnamed protein product [Brassica napus]
MKVAFKPWLIGFFMLTIFLFGETAIAQKKKTDNQCNIPLINKSGTCAANQCQAACVKRHKEGVGKCTTNPDKKMRCICFYLCPR